MMPSDDAWQENLTRTLTRITVGSGAILVGHLCIGILFLTISVAGPDSDSAITGLPMATGTFSSALLAGGLAGQAVVRKACVWTAPAIHHCLCLVEWQRWWTVERGSHQAPCA
jgi:hypothetical protein